MQPVQPLHPVAGAAELSQKQQFLQRRNHLGSRGHGIDRIHSQAKNVLIVRKIRFVNIL